VVSIPHAGGGKAFEANLYLCEYLYRKEIAKLFAKGLAIDWDFNTVSQIIIDNKKKSKKLFIF
tara:strand:+ start:334 stop:522 length:189 start_codon:yes stop_codon:yes gene_type:complete